MMHPGKRRLLLPLAVIAALLSHVALFRLLDLASKTPGSTGEGPRIMTVVALTPRQSADSGALPVLDPRFTPSASPMVPANRMAQAERPDEALTSPKSSPEPLHGTAVYLPSEAVDRRARPLTDWLLRTDVLPPDRLYVLTVTVWVSAQGRIDRWHIRDQSVQGAWAAEVLAHLQETAMEPALLDGRSVAVEMSVQIALDNRLR